LLRNEVPKVVELAGYIALANSSFLYGINILNNVRAGETVIVSNENEPMKDLEESIRFSVYWHYVYTTSLQL